jgi:hypothetical protein
VAGDDLVPTHVAGAHRDRLEKAGQLDARRELG